MLKAGMRCQSTNAAIRPSGPIDPDRRYSKLYSRGNAVLRPLELLIRHAGNSTSHCKYGISYDALTIALNMEHWNGCLIDTD